MAAMKASSNVGAKRIVGSPAKRSPVQARGPSVKDVKQGPTREAYSPPTPAQDSEVEVRRAELPARIETLGDQTTSIEHLLSELETRLTPVRSDSVAMAADGNAPADLSYTTYGSDLQVLIDRQGNLAMRLQNLLYQLEV